MNLGVSTIWLFAFLMPGLIFRYFLFHGSIIYKPIFGGNPIYAGILVVLLAAAIHMLTAVLVLGLPALAIWTCQGLGLLLASDFTMHSLVQEIWQAGEVVPHALTILVPYFLISLLVAYTAAKLARFLSERFHFVRSILFGPFANLFDSSSVNLLVAFVLTKVTYRDKIVAYAGIPSEIGVTEGAKVDYIVLEEPWKFYLKFGQRWPVTTYRQARRIGEADASFMFISSGDIENVHLEGWGFVEQA